MTLLLVAAYLTLLFPVDERRSHRLWLLPALMLLWVNLHGAFVLGIGLVALVALGETVHWLRCGGSPPQRLWLAGIATVAAAAVNPSGWRMLAYPFTYLGRGDNPSFSIVTEFQSPNFHEPMSLVFAAGLVLLILLGAARGAMPGVNALLASVFTVQALISTRQISPCALVLAPILAAALHERFPWTRERPEPRLPRGFSIANWTLLVCLVIAGVAYAHKPKNRQALQLGWVANVGDMPVAGAAYIEANDLPDPVFNFQPWGGYLIDRWYPHRRVFIDGRIDMYGSDILHDYREVTTIQPGWHDVLDKYGVRTVLTAKGSALSVLLREAGGWEPVFQGEVEDVFVRRKGQ